MPDYRRSKDAGGIYFFTVVTFNRLPILTTPESMEIFHAAWNGVQKKHPFKTLAICVLPDHLHTVWQMPEDDDDYSMRWKEIKRQFTAGYLEKIGSDGERNDSRVKRMEAAIWQRRFWEHTIRDDDDLHNHFDYIHYNPVKHGLVSDPADWPWSSYQRFAKSGFYPQGWLAGDKIIKMDEE
jgi:putative transposase